MAQLSLAQCRLRYVVEARPLDEATKAALEADSRSGAKTILAAVRRRHFENRSEGQRLRKLLRYENALWSAGVDLVAGVDEAGMSPLAGPVAAAAVIFKPGSRIPGVDDSKKLDAASREMLAAEIKQVATAWSVGFAAVAEIHTINIYWAGVLAMRRAVEGLSRAPHHVLIDARRIKDLPMPQQPIVKGDSKSLSIAAASVLAKTARDALMHTLDAQHPGYGFAKHKGYPVEEHLAALKRLGASPIHRRSFGPVRLILGLPPLPPAASWRGILLARHRLAALSPYRCRRIERRGRRGSIKLCFWKSGALRYAHRRGTNAHYAKSPHLRNRARLRGWALGSHIKLSLYDTVPQYWVAFCG